jgi:multidrug efflux pump subunit AcrB
MNRRDLITSGAQLLVAGAGAGTQQQPVRRFRTSRLHRECRSSRLPQCTPNIYADIDRVKAAKLGVPPERVFEAMQVYLGSAYINDFNYLGRTYQVIAQADDRFRMTAADIARFKTRNDTGQMVPVGSVARFHDISGPYRLPRHNQFPAAEVQGSAAPGVSSGTALAAMEELAAQRLPQD